MRSIHVFVSGEVQGVFFRATTKEEADRLSIQGWVRNLDDGRVETLAEGSDESISKFIGFLHKGSDAARVDKVEVLNDDSSEDLVDFIVLH